MIDWAKNLFSTGYYDATQDRGRRKSPRTTVKHEDQIAKRRERETLSATTHDILRNFVVAAWAVRKHLDFVSRYKFQGKVGDDGFNEDLEQAIAEASKRNNFDASRRHSLRSATRLAEASRVKDGDVGWMKLASGRHRGQVQAIEGTRIHMPGMRNLQNPDDWTNGIRVHPSTGEAIEYAVCDRSSQGTLSLRRRVPARNMLFHAFYDRYDQVRGVSPLAASLNWFRDTYEGFEYAQAKLKVGQLFGLVINQDADTNPFGSAVSATTDPDSDDTLDAAHEVDLSAGIFNLDLDPGEKAEILESKNPSSETTEFLKLMIHVCLKSLDLPMSFWDEAHTNFFGSKSAINMYLKSCKDKVEALQQFLDEWTRWRVGLMVKDGDLLLPSGMDFNDIAWQWVPDGVPWWDPVKEIRGQAMAVATAFDNPYSICNTVGTNFEENIRLIAKATAYAEEHGVTLTYADSTAFRPEITTQTEDQ